MHKHPCTLSGIHTGISGVLEQKAVPLVACIVSAQRTGSYMPSDLCFTMPKGPEAGESYRLSCKMANSQSTAPGKKSPML